MTSSIHLMIAKIRAEKLLVDMPENHPFRSAYEDFVENADAYIAKVERLEDLRAKWAAEDLEIIE